MKGMKDFIDDKASEIREAAAKQVEDVTSEMNQRLAAMHRRLQTALECNTRLEHDVWSALQQSDGARRAVSPFRTGLERLLTTLMQSPQALDCRLRGRHWNIRRRHYDVCTVNGPRTKQEAKTERDLCITRAGSPAGRFATIGWRTCIRRLGSSLQPR